MVIILSVCLFLVLSLLGLCAFLSDRYNRLKKQRKPLLLEYCHVHEGPNSVLSTELISGMALLDIEEYQWLLCTSGQSYKAKSIQKSIDDLKIKNICEVNNG